jgi:outer membrane receptor protein involved in Fe transport
MKIVSKIIILIIISSTPFLIGQSAPNQFGSGSVPKGKLTGYLIDAQTGQPIEYGNVVILKYSDSTLVDGTVSGAQGNFTLEIPYGKYFLKASFIGYSTRILDSIKVNPRNLEIDLGKIALDESSIEIENVVVTGEKQMIINNLDKKVINVEKDLTGTGGTATDVVQNIPSVTVDVNGNVSYRGNQNLTILIDGKPSSMMGMSNADILANLPASSIESIELVTNPSARYDPDGSSGILNFILKKRVDGGVNGNISATAGTGDKFNGSININYRLPDFNFFTSYDARMSENGNNGNTSRTNNINNSVSYLNQDNNGLFDFSSHNITAGMDYMPDNFNTLTFSYRFRKFGFDSENLVKNTSLNSFEDVTNYFERSSIADRGVNSNNYTVSYKRTFETKGAELTTDIIFGDNSMNRDENIVQTNFNTDFTPSTEPPYLERGLSDNSNQQWTIQSNYINPIEGFGRIETGFKVSLKDLNSLNNYEYFDDASSTWVNKLLSNTNFLYQENIYAVYGIFSNSIDKFQYQFGLRAEQANVNGSESITTSSFEKDYFALYPTVHLVQGLPDDQEIQLSYSRRVERPNNRQLNPYVDRSDSLNVQFGNPRLNPEFVNSLDLGYSKFFNKTSLTSSLFYKLTDDAISTVTFIKSNGVTETTWLNIAKSQSYGVELTGSHPVADWLRLNGSLSYFNTSFEAQDVVRKDNSWIGKIAGTIFFAKDFNVQLNANYNSPIITAQGTIKEVFSADFAAKKDFMDGQLSLTFRVSDIFNTRKMESETYGFNFNSTSYRKMESRVAYLGISYRLSTGKSKENERKRRTDESGMDDF